MPNHPDTIQDEPLRDPGQSLRELIRERFHDTAMAWMTVARFAVLVAILEWIRWAANVPYQPVFITIIAVALTVFAAWRVRRAFSEVQQWKLGLKGERYVGQYLQAMLMPRGYTVTHDICIDQFNVDHVVIGPAGVFSIEVKTRSKRRGPKSRVKYDGQRLFVDGFAPDRDPVAQARDGAKRIRQILQRNSGKDVAVRPVVLFPYWWVDPQPRGVEVWVLNEKAFISFVENETVRLSLEEIKMLSEGLACHVRSQLEAQPG